MTVRLISKTVYYKQLYIKIWIDIIGSIAGTGTERESGREHSESPVRDSERADVHYFWGNYYWKQTIKKWYDVLLSLSV